MAAVLACIAMAAFFGGVYSSIRFWFLRLAFLEKLRVYNANMAAQGHPGHFDLAAYSHANKFALANKWRHQTDEEALIEPDYMGNEHYWETVYAYRNARRALTIRKWICFGLFGLVAFSLRGN